MARAKDEVVLRLQEVVEPVLASLGYECVFSEIVTENGRRIVRLYIDRLEQFAALGSVGIEDCVKATRELDRRRAEPRRRGARRAGGGKQDEGRRRKPGSDHFCFLQH